ncbi:MAG: zinc ribbon domain-containing protein [Gammaproteobacteria bacterium]
MSKRQILDKFLCIDCGYENNADVVGAINILER